MKTTRLADPETVEIVVIDDEPEALRSIAESLLVFAGSASVRTFSRDDEAERYFDRQNLLSRVRSRPRLRLILMDLNVDGVKRFRMLSRLRQLRFIRHTPVVVFSDSGSADDVRRSYECGANAFVIKPVNFEAFDTAVQTIARFWLELNKPATD